MGKSKYHPSNVNWNELHEKELEVMEENRKLGLPFDIDPDLKKYIDSKNKSKK